MLTLPDLNRLKVFYVVYANKSIIRAANVLNVTRSAVSQSLKALEKEIHTTLFIRDSKKVQPTPAAETLVQPTGKALVLKCRRGRGCCQSKPGIPQPKTCDRLPRWKWADFPAVGGSL